MSIHGFNNRLPIFLLLAMLLLPCAASAERLRYSTGRQYISYNERMEVLASVVDAVFPDIREEDKKQLWIEPIDVYDISDDHRYMSTIFAANVRYRDPMEMSVPVLSIVIHQLPHW